MSSFPYSPTQDKILEANMHKGDPEERSKEDGSTENAQNWEGVLFIQLTETQIWAMLSPNPKGTRETLLRVPCSNGGLEAFFGSGVGESFPNTLLALLMFACLSSLTNSYFYYISCGFFNWSPIDSLVKTLVCSILWCWPSFRLGGVCAEWRGAKRRQSISFTRFQSSWFLDWPRSGPSAKEQPFVVLCCQRQCGWW